MGGHSDDDISSCLTGDTVSVYVGRKNKRYSVHEALLTQYAWFRASLRGYSNAIWLTSEDPQVFELLIGWLYRKKLNAISTTDEEIAMEEVKSYVNLYLRACDWEIDELQNALMDRLRTRRTCEYGYFPRTMIKTIYEKTKEQSPLRSYIVDNFIYKGIAWDEDNEWEDPIDDDYVLTRQRALKTQLDAGNQEFVLDCYEALFQLCAKTKIRDPSRRTGCVYHTHEDGKKCWK